MGSSKAEEEGIRLEWVKGMEVKMVNVTLEVRNKKIVRLKVQKKREVLGARERVIIGAEVSLL